MSDTVKQIEQLQAQYDALEREGAEKFGTKSRLLLEKQLRDEMKKKLDALGGDRDAFKARKGEAFRALHAAKTARLAEIKAGVASGEIAPDAAAAEIVSLGWETGVAKAAIDAALKPPTGHVETLAQPEPAVPPEIMDPVGAEQPVAREVVYAEPGRSDEQAGKGKGRKGK